MIIKKTLDLFDKPVTLYGCNDQSFGFGKFRKSILKEFKLGRIKKKSTISLRKEYEKYANQSNQFDASGIEKGGDTSTKYY